MVKKHSYILVIATVLSLLCAASCGGGKSDAATVIQEKGELVEFSIKTFEGETVTPEDYRGKVVLVDYWATWCAPCRKEFPHFNKLLDTYGDGLVIIAITTDTDMTLLENFLEEKPLRFIIGLAAETITPSWKEPQEIPEAFIIDREGYLRAHLEGGHKFDDFDEIIKPLIEEKVPALVEPVPLEPVPDAAGEAEKVEVPEETDG